MGGRGIALGKTKKIIIHRKGVRASNTLEESAYGALWPHNSSSGDKPKYLLYLCGQTAADPLLFFLCPLLFFFLPFCVVLRVSSHFFLMSLCLRVSPSSCALFSFSFFPSSLLLISCIILRNFFPSFFHGLCVFV